MSWRDARRPPRRQKNQGCVYCGAPPTRYIWLRGAGRVVVCDGHAVAKERAS